MLTLHRHCSDAEESARNLFSGRLLGRWCHFFGVKDEAKFLLHLRVAALFHDVGKANSDFVAAVGRKRGEAPHWQAIRHEHLSAMFLHLAPVRAWLKRSQLDLPLITAAVLCHHLKAIEAGDRYAWGTVAEKRTLAMYLAHTDVTNILADVAAPAGLDPYVGPLPSSFTVTDPVWDAAIEDGFAEEARLRKELRRDGQRKRLSMALKAALICADASASGLQRSGLPIGEWVREVAEQAPLSPEDVEAAILEPRRRKTEQRSGIPFIPHQFQIGASKAGQRVLLLAGCGAGKTTAAWMWVAEQARCCSFSKAIFLYPTRGTTTEGYRDYVDAANAGPLRGDMLHSSAKYELAALRRENAPESTLDTGEDGDEAEARLRNFPSWKGSFFASTADQFLSFMQNLYAGFILLPALADSVLIVDEVHSYDEQMFNTLIQFLKLADIPVLCMTATLSGSRREALANAGLSIYPNNAQDLADLAQRETASRYAPQIVSGWEAAWCQVTEAAAAGKRVLWVVNRVAECQMLAAALSDAGVKTLCYHSRFTGKDRRARHREVVDAFSTPGPLVVVTTQVCEMSLDLDADLLVSEIAPASSLVQRMGRVNRAWDTARAAPRLAPAPCLFYVPPKTLPYETWEIEHGKAFVKGLPPACSQADLERVMSETAAMYDKASMQFDVPFGGGYFSPRGSFRDGQEHTLSAILTSDLPAALALRERYEPLDEYICPIPTRSSIEHPDRADLPKYIHVADSASYCSAYGFKA